MSAFESSRLSMVRLLSLATITIFNDTPLLFIFSRHGIHAQLPTVCGLIDKDRLWWHPVFFLLTPLSAASRWSHKGGEHVKVGEIGGKKKKRKCSGWEECAHQVFPLQIAFDPPLSSQTVISPFVRRQYPACYFRCNKHGLQTTCQP